MNRNVGIDILRVIASFLVVAGHFESGCSLGVLAVPSFMFIAFFYYGRLLKSENTLVLLKRRLFRLAIPYVFWSFIASIVLLLAHRSIDIIDIIAQVILGSTFEINPPEWYIFDLIVLTVSISLLYINLDDKVASWFLALISIATIVLQYTEINYRIFADLSYKIKYPLGRLCEMFPYAALGILFFRCGFLDKVKKKGFFLFILLGIIVAYGGVFDRFTRPVGFSYQGLSLILGTVCAVSFFYHIPQCGIPKGILNVVNFLAKYSMGVYYIHFFLGGIMIDFLCYSPLVNSIIIYLASLFISYVISLIPIKNVEKLVV